MLTTILICTCNRADSLRETLQCMGRVKLPQSALVDLLVVDNGSSDGTADVVKAFVPDNGLRVRCLAEQRRGKDFAYNSGIREAEGEVLLFTDDDVRVPQNWVAGMVAPIMAGRGDAVAGGVRLAPHLERPWLTPLMKGLLATTGRIDDASPHTLVGANMAIHRRVFEKIAGFDQEIGPGTWYGLGDESLLAEQIRVAGFRIAGALDVEVEHHCDVSRLSRQALLDMARKTGRSEAYMYWHWTHETVRSPRPHLLRGLCSYARRYGWRALRTPGAAEGGVTDNELRLVKTIAFFRQYLRETQRPRNYERQGLTKKDSNPGTADA